MIALLVSAILLPPRVTSSAGKLGKYCTIFHKFSISQMQESGTSHTPYFIQEIDRIETVKCGFQVYGLNYLSFDT